MFTAIEFVCPHVKGGNVKEQGMEYAPSCEFINKFTRKRGLELFGHWAFYLIDCNLNIFQVSTYLFKGMYA